MIKHYLTTLIFAASITALSATDHTISIQGLAYVPSNLVVQIGDNVTIEATGSHPTTEVSEETWNANGTTELAGGFGSFNEPFTITITDADPIYYVCENHVGQGMKGQISVEPSSVDEYVNAIEVNLGSLPVMDGRLDYSISSERALNGSFAIVSINGQTMAEQTIGSVTGSVPTPFAKGVYVAIIRDENGRLLFRRSISID